MAEAIGLAPSIIALLNLTVTVVHYIENVSSGSKYRERMLSELNHIQHILNQLRDQTQTLNENNVPTEALSWLALPNGPLDQFQVTLERLLSKLKPVVGFKKFGKALVWPFQTEEIEDILSTVERQKSLFILVLQSDQTRLSQAISSDLQKVSDNLGALQLGHNDQERQLREAESRKVVAWLSSVNQWVKQYHFFEIHEDGTGEWLLNAPEFMTWLQEPGKTLWCTGIPGAGKTIISSVIIDHLIRIFVNKQDVGVVFYYCNYNEKVSCEGLLCSLLQQLLQRRTFISPDVRDVYEKHIKKGTMPSMHECSKLLQSEVSTLSRTFVVLDALDECSDRIRDQFLFQLRALRPKLSLLITTRPHIVNIHADTGISLEIRGTDHDIKKYIEGHIQKQSKLKRHVERDPSLHANIIDTIIEKAKGMFLLAHLHIGLLARKHNRRDVKNALESLPKELDDAYDELVKRILSQNLEDVNLAKQVLTWVTNAKRALTAAELQHALTITPNSLGIDDEALTEVDHLIAVCAGMMTFDRESGAIGLVHHTAQQYLERIQNHQFQGAETCIAMACLTYLGFPVFDGPDLPYEAVKEEVQKYEFGDYAARYWADHVRGVLETELQDTILSTFLSEGRRRRVIQIVDSFGSGWESRPLLHFFARHGLDTICKALLDGVNPIVAGQIPGLRENLKAVDEDGQTALHVAAKHGHIKVVELFLPNARIETKDFSDRTPLYSAAAQGHSDVVNALLNINAKVETKDMGGRTPLMAAAGNGHSAVVTALLNVKAKLEAKDTCLLTAMSWAAMHGHVEVVKILINAKADIETECQLHLTPLHWVVRSRASLEVVDLLLKANADVETEDGLGKTPLGYAAMSGQAEVVRKLLKSKANIEAKDCDGRAPLSFAAGSGNTEALQILLKAEADVETKDEKGRTPLSWAAGDGQTEALRILLDENSNIETRDRMGRTPLSWAAGNGKTEVVKLLLEADAEIETKNQRGRSPLSVAAAKGHTEVLEALLQAGAEIETRDCEGQTPLIVASRMGHSKVVEHLLDAGAEREAKTDEGRTALSWAAGNGHVDLVKTLLQTDAQVNTKDHMGLTPLIWAEERGKSEVMKLLKEKSKEHEGEKK